MDALAIIEQFYPEDDALRRLLLDHSRKVRDKALAILHSPQCPCRAQLDESLVRDGALLHDIGIGRCHAPSICCHGAEDYLRHGIIGAEMLRGLSPDLEPCARICERHTGAGISRQEIIARHLPLPPGDYLPVAAEEKLVCLADKFYSKSGDMREKTLQEIVRGLSRFGADSVARFRAMCGQFGLAE